MKPAAYMAFLVSFLHLGGALAEPCGEISPRGVCSDNSVLFCFEDELKEIDCDALNATCDDEWVGLCLVPPGGQCLAQGADGSTLLLTCDPASGPMGCDGVTGTCVAVSGQCTETSEPSCVGDILQIQCVLAQPFQVACADIRSTGCSDGACRDVPSGGPCSELLHCRAGLACLADVNGQGMCTHTSETVPPDWTCPVESYDRGNRVCNCDCGAYDPDCDDDFATISGCRSTIADGVSCSDSGVCVEPQRDDMRPESVEDPDVAGGCSCGSFTDFGTFAGLALLGLLRRRKSLQ